MEMIQVQIIILGSSAPPVQMPIPQTIQTAKSDNKPPEKTIDVRLLLIYLMLLYMYYNCCIYYPKHSIGQLFSVFKMLLCFAGS